MITTTIKRLRSALAASLLLGLAVAVQADPVTLELAPSAQTAGTGDGVSLDLVISGLDSEGADSLGDFDIDIAFDAARLLLDSFTLTDLLGDLGLGDAIDLSADLGGGLLNLVLISLLETDDQNCIFCIGPFLDEIQGSSFVLATLNFSVLDLEPGNSTTVSIAGVNALGDGFGLPLEIAELGDAVIRNPSIGVPEPGTLSLIGMGLLAIFGLRSRRREIRV
ncbi:MAG: PEP-CTERM sorting domain-containing protein [Woeseiaceae bacterium]|nr:PEP-CTERM sorting domain-containing protein [Woeseiaceae bacterium]